MIYFCEDREREKDVDIERVLKGERKRESSRNLEINVFQSDLINQQQNKIMEKDRERIHLSELSE